MFHPARGNHESLLRDLQDLYGNCAWVRTKDRIDEGWFEGRFLRSKERLGEIALLARDPVAFLDKENPT